MRIRNGRVIGLGDAVGKQLSLVFTHLRIGNVVSLVVIAAGDCRHIAFRHGFRAEDGRIEHTIDNAQYDQCTGDDAADQDRLLSFWVEWLSFTLWNGWHRNVGRRLWHGRNRSR